MLERSFRYPLGIFLLDLNEHEVFLASARRAF